MDKPVDLNDRPARAERDPREVVIPIDGPYRITPDPRTAALNNLAYAIRELAQAIRAPQADLERVRYEAYGEGRDDEAADLPLRYEEPKP